MYKIYVSSFDHVFRVLSCRGNKNISEADLVCRQCLTEGINFFRKWKKLSEFSDLFGIAILLSVHVSCVASLCVSLYTYGLHW